MVALAEPIGPEKRNMHKWVIYGQQNKPVSRMYDYHIHTHLRTRERYVSPVKSRDLPKPAPRSHGRETQCLAGPM